MGTADEIAVVASREVWDALEHEIITALEPRMFTVREERILDVTYVEPEDVASGELRRMRRVLLIGSPHEAFIAQALSGRDTEPFTPPVVVQLPDVWAKKQLVTVALLPDRAEPRILAPMLPRIRDAFLQQFEDQIRLGMAVIPPSDRIAARLRRAAGITLAVPRTYRYEQLEPSVFVFRREEQGYTPVVRTIAIDSRARGSTDWTAEAARAWRAELAERSNDPPHVTETRSRSRGDLAGRPTIQIQGVWSHAPGEWPSAGPFTSRMVQCSNRVFLIDAWLYAPVDDKYEYIYELDRILDTFRCPADAAAARS